MTINDIETINIKISEESETCWFKRNLPMVSWKKPETPYFEREGKPFLNVKTAAGSWSTFVVDWVPVEKAQWFAEMMQLLVDSIEEQTNNRRDEAQRAAASQLLQSLKELGIVFRK